jgi:hypothetical protein
MNYVVPVSADHIRTIKDPNRPQIRVVHALARVTELPKDIPLEPDPRVPKVKGPVIKKIAGSLATNDGRFHLLNRGITISARNVEFDNIRNVLTLDIPKEDAYGIIDGGHTYHAINNAGAPLLHLPKDQPPAGLTNQYVHLEILVNIESDLADIAEARNYSVSLKAWTLAGYRDKFDWFLKALGPDYTRHVKISENDPQPIGILDLIQVISAMNPGLFREGTSAVEAYKNAGKCLEYFIDEKDQHGFRKMEPVCRDIVRLYDYVRYNWKKAYNAEDPAGKHGRLGALTVMQQRKKNRDAMATYYFLDAAKGPVKGEDLPVEKGFAIPLVASLRALLEEKKGKYSWYTSPFKFFDEHGDRLVKIIMTANERASDNPHTVGRDAGVYMALYSEVRRWYLEGKLAKLESARA